MNQIVMYGITNCDTMKKARTWLEQNQLAYEFHDFRKDGLTAKQIQFWVSQLPLDTLINKRSTSWRALDTDTQNNLSEENAVALLLDTPTLIKRPLMQVGDHIFCGFNAKTFTDIFLN